MSRIVVVSGTRTIPEQIALEAFEIMHNEDDAWLSHDQMWRVGDARGVDRVVAEHIRSTMDDPVEIWPADWAAHGKAAGPIRNANMITGNGEAMATELWAIWDGLSRGTLHAIPDRVSLWTARARPHRRTTLAQHNCEALVIAKLAAAIIAMCATTSTCPDVFRTHSGASELAHVMVFAADEHGTEPLLLTSLAWHESRFSPTAVSRRGAVGILQVLPALWAARGFCRHYKCVRAQARSGAAALAWYQRRCRSDIGAIRGYRSGRCYVRVGAPAVLRTRDRLREEMERDARTNRA